jgi:hypothetical protein
MGVLGINPSVAEASARLEHGIADSISEGVGFEVPFTHAFTWFEKQLELLQDVRTYLDTAHIW